MPSGNSNEEMASRLMRWKISEERTIPERAKHLGDAATAENQDLKSGP